MTFDLASPDAVIALHPDSYAPRAARHCVRTVDRPSPDLRDVVVLLASELVTRAVRLSEPDSQEFVELRVWMPADVVRVELRGAPELLCAPPSEDPQDDLLLVDELADRWSVDNGQAGGCIWFEIDRHAPNAPRDGAHADGQLASAWQS